MDSNFLLNRKDGDAKKKTTWSNTQSIEWDGPHILRYNAKDLVTYKFFLIV